ncbi:MAG: polysaccharide export protein [Acidobacteriota bacterium]|nr:polysaccharide export protein [Acidobacteriota bacterium]
MKVFEREFRVLGVTRPLLPALAAILLLPGWMAAQQPAPASQAPGAPPAAAAEVQPAAGQQFRPNYVLGISDQILIRAFEVDEINEKQFRIDSDGTVTMPLIGIVKAAGLTVQELEVDLTTRLKKYVKDPHVTISVIQFRTEPVFIVGAFQKPGIWPLDGRRTLVEMLTMVGGLQPNASRRITITRRQEAGVLPLPNAMVDTENKVSTAEINIGSLRDNVNPAEDIVLAPYDKISVERAEQVYTQGAFLRVAAFELGERDSISVLQVLTLAGGLAADADASQAEILRPVLNTSRRAEIRIDLNSVLAARSNDVPLLPNDILYVPRTKGVLKPILAKAALIGVPLLSSLIFLAFR